MRTQQAKQATVGARNVITTASAMGRYCSESSFVRDLPSLVLNHNSQKKPKTIAVISYV